MIARILILAAVFGLMQVARSFAPDEGPLTQTSSGALGLGFLMLAGFFMGRVFSSLKLPRLTGYICTGLLAGPYILNLFTHSMAHDLRVLNGCAVALIGMTAGVETDLRSIRPLIKTITVVSLLAVTATQVLLAAAIFAMRPWLPFLHALDTRAAIAVSAVIGIALGAKSPAVVCALRDETRADGPVSRATLGIVVLSDLLVLVGFTVASSVTEALLQGHANPKQTLIELSWHVFGSLGVGLMLGVVVAFYLRKVETNAPLFLLALAFVVAEIGSHLDLDPLLVCLATGILVQNLTPSGRILGQEIGRAWLPVSILFFGVAGATVHLDVLTTLAVPVVVLLVLRAVGLVGFTRWSARLAGAPPEVVKYAGFGLLPQAGLALALALLFARAFPDFGAAASALIVGVVACNEIITPAVFRLALLRSGEAGKRDPSEVGEVEAH